MRLSAPAPRARLIRILLCLLLLAHSLLPVSAAAAGRDVIKAAPPAGKVSAGQEVEAANLPDLDEARRRPRHEPKAVPPVPSTRRRCPPRNPRCNDGDGAAPRPTPTPHVIASSGQGEGFIAGLSGESLLEQLTAALSGRRPALDVPELDYYLGGWYSVSDSPRARGLLPFAAAPALAVFQSARTNVALASNGGVATASSTYPTHSTAALNDGDRRGPGYGGIWADTTSYGYPDWVQIDFAGAKVIDEVALFSVQNNGFTNSVEPTATMTGSQYVVTSFDVQYWTGTAWATVQGGSVTGNNLIWRRVTFPEVTTTKVRFVINATADNYSQVPEVEVWGREAPHVNHALAFNGATAAASSQAGAGYPAAAAINGERRGLNWASGGGWADGTSDAYPDWLEVSFGGERRIDEVDIIGLQENYASPSEPTEAMTGRFALSDFQVQYWTGSAWAAVSGGSVTNNNKVWRRFTFPEVTTTKVRVWVTRVAGDNHSQVVELEAWGALYLQPGTGLTGEYYDGADFETYRLTRPDAAIDFDWGTGSPAPSVGADNFSARWTGTVVPRYTEDYTFYTYTDDGVRLWLDGQLVIDRWQEQTPYEAASAPVALEAGRAYALRMEFFERWGGARARLQWSSASQAKEVVPQSRLYGCWKGADQFAKDFFLGALWRQPSAAESQDWAGRLSQAQGEYQLVAEAQGLGAQVFASNEYAARNRADSEYVADLYRAYLQRAPDQGGLTSWTAHITPCGTDQACRAQKRAEVRAAFDQSGEFQEKVRNLCGTAASSPANGGAGYNFTTARLDPVNRTGGGGVDAYSRNYNFSIPLVSLAGRAGLDLGLMLSYNSLVWTKDSTGVTFDADQGFPSPGFRLGFPTVEPKFVNPLIQQTGQPVRYSYLLVTPSGARVELRQVGASNVYESADSSYLQLTEAGGLTLRSTDGTQLTFIPLGGSYRCYEVKDSNGNYLSVAYYGDGRIDKVIDTLGRAVTFNYDAFQNLISITQPWKRETEASPSGVDESHKWATFGYSDVTLQPSFSNLAIVGEQPGAVIPALNQVGLADGSYYKFSYNQWGQVWKVTRYAADSLGVNGQPDDSHPLSSTRIDLPGSDLLAASPQADCPRFKEERVWVEYGVMNNSAEVATSYSPWGPNVASCDITPPDPTPGADASDDVTVTELYETAGWKRGLTKRTETYAGGQSVRTMTTSWEHDGSDAALYPTNPRVTQTTVSDPQGNGRTTRVTYTTPADFQLNNGYADTLDIRLPRAVEECADGNCSTVLRTTVTDYGVPNLGQYVARRILGLARYRYVYEGAEATGNLRSKVGYVHDDTGNVNGDTNQPKFLKPLPSPAWQHYKDDYGTALQWRGNVTRVRRYEVSQQSGTESGSFAESLAGYNVAGAAVFSQDAAGHRTTVSYADAFYAEVNRTGTNPQLRLQTYAYPTSVTDPDGFTSWSWYNYDMGVATKVRTQKPNATTNGPDGPVASVFHDGAGRPVKTTNSVNGANTEWVYDPGMTLVKTFKTVSDESVQNPNLRLYSATALDGAGRVRGTAREFLGSTTVTPAGNYSAQITRYDAMGRAVFRSNPTEMRIADSEWKPAGDDANGGLWRGTTQEYDWKGRPTRTVNPDGTDRLFEYGGCGCAGGEVVTERGELVPIPGRQTQGRRARKIHSDVLGRAWKTEALDWDGNVYTATTTRYDALDRAVRVRQYAGAAPWPEPTGEGATYQTTSMEYDGHGRLHSQRLPKYAPNTATLYEYNADDTPKSVTDPRGVKANYSYNNRHLPSAITYDTVEGVADTPDVSFAYDAAGNRTSMADGTGSIAYEYDILSRLISEKRLFSGLPQHAAYETVYHYTASGQLEYLIDPAGSRVDYDYDKTGRVRGVSGSGPASAAAYASDMSYRAWGALKEVDFGNQTHQYVGYDGRLQPSTMELRNVLPFSTSQTPQTMRWDYDYYADGRLDHAYDRHDDRFDRKFDYDAQGRLKEAYSGREARGLAPAPTPDSPYRQTFGYDAWGNMTGRSGRFWRRTLSAEASSYGADDRRDGWGYDAAGNLTGDDSHSNTYDAAGGQTYAHSLSGGCGEPDYEIAQEYDGEGRPARRSQTTRRETGAEPPCVTAAEQTYYVYAAGLGGVKLVELDAAGQKVRGYVYGGGALLAEQELYPSAPGTYDVRWQHRNPGSTSWVETDADRVFGRREMDPLGADVGSSDPFNVPREPGYWDVHTEAPLFVKGGDPLDLSGGCSGLGDMPVTCSVRADLFNTSAGGYDNGVSTFAYGPRIGEPTNPPIDYAPDFLDWLYRKGYENRSLDDLYHLSAEYGRELAAGIGSPQKNVPAASQRKILKNLRKCVSEFFNVDLKSFTPAMLAKDGTPKNGTFVGFGYDSLKNENTNITVTTDPGMYNHRDLTTMYNNFQKDHPEYPLLRRGNAAAGLTLPNSMVRLNDQYSESFIPYYNFVANDLYTDPKTSDWALEILHVHELGHALAIITGKTRGEDGDELEFCVFGHQKPH